MHLGTEVNRVDFGIKRSKVKVTVIANVNFNDNEQFSSPCESCNIVTTAVP